MNLTNDEIIIPEEAHLLVAKGAALDSLNQSPISIEKLKSKIEVLRISHDDTTKPLKPLFSIDVDYKEFKERHNKHCVPKKHLKDFKGDCFIGIDAGSTTTKLVVIDSERNFIIFFIWK